MAGALGGMEDRPGAHDRLGSAEEILDNEKIAIAQNRLERGHLRIGAQDEGPVRKRTSSASLPASISNERSPLAPALRR